MRANPRLFVGIALLTVFGALAFLNFNRSIAPYVGFSEARAASGAVQVAGYPAHQAASFDTQSGQFRFTMTDDGGDEMSVAYKGPQPGNFDQAEKVVVVGRYTDQVFHADQILVKCPSKYDDAASEGLKQTATGS